MATELEETVKDQNTYIQIEDFSDNMSKYVRDYSINVNDTYTLSTTVEIKSHWSLEQEFKHANIFGGLSWVNLDLLYTGTEWYQVIEWDGDDKVVAKHTHDLNDDSSSIMEFIFYQPNDLLGLYCSSQIDFKTAMWKLKVGSSFDPEYYQQNVNLLSGEWIQEYWFGDTLVWQDKFSLAGTEWNFTLPYDDEEFYPYK